LLDVVESALSRRSNSTIRAACSADYLLEGGVFTPDLIKTWITLKRENEIDPLRLRPHPFEFAL
jgi:glutamine synthetase